jgi:hypothetical protein
MKDRRQYKGTSIFLIFRQLIHSELTEIEEYINEISSDLLEKQKRLDEDYEKANSEVADNAEFDPHFFFEDDINKYFKVFPIYTYNPLLLTLYGQFENWLKKLCDLDSRKGFSQIKVSDLAGINYIEKSRRYLKLVSEINFEGTENEWRRITEIQKIRNCIAHSNSNMYKNKSQPIEKQELYTCLLNDNRIELDNLKGDFYIKDKEYLLDVIDLIKKYLDYIIDQLKGRKVIAKNTTMPFNNENWGKEKSETLIKMVISSLELLDKNEIRDDEFKDANLKANLRGTFESMTHDLTKLYAFFSNGKWEITDQDIIVKEREDGLNKLRQIYNT